MTNSPSSFHYTYLLIFSPNLKSQVISYSSMSIKSYVCPHYKNENKYIESEFGNVVLIWCLFQCKGKVAWISEMGSWLNKVWSPPIFADFRNREEEEEKGVEGKRTIEKGRRERRKRDNERKGSRERRETMEEKGVGRKEEEEREREKGRSEGGEEKELWKNS